MFTQKFLLGAVGISILLIGVFIFSKTESENRNFVNENSQFELMGIERHENNGAVVKIIKLQNKETGEYLYFIKSGQTISQVQLKAH